MTILVILYERKFPTKHFSSNLDSNIFLKIIYSSNSCNLNDPQTIKSMKMIFPL